MACFGLRACISATAILAAISAFPVTASAANCTKAQSKAADERLRAIEQSEADQAAILQRHLPFGIHTTTHASDNSPRNEQLLLQDGYVMVHDGDLRTALWTAHRLDGADVAAGDDSSRIDCFRKDPRLPADHAAAPVDYDEPIYDLGHMTSDRDLRDNLIKQLNTYVLSNMSPQHCRFNRGVWLTLENLGREWAKLYGTVYITQGAIFDFNPRDARDKDKAAARIGSRGGKARVAVPSHYFKNFLRQDGSRWLSITFLLENHNGPRGRSMQELLPALENSVVGMEVVKQRGEIGLHPDLRQRQRLEAGSFADWEITNRAGQLRDNLEGSCPQ